MLVLVPIGLGPIAMASGLSSPAALQAPGLTGRSLGDVIAAENDEPVLESDAGQAALHSAGALKKHSYALEGEEREAGLLRAAAAYGVVADSEAFGTLDRVEGAFRAGEIYRARGKVQEARTRFAQAVLLGETVAVPSVREFAARALLEEAHQLRREGELGRALEVYKAVRSRFEDCHRPCTHAVTWAGKILLKEGRVNEARRTFLDFEPFLPDYPLEAVRNVNQLVDVLVAQGEAEQAHEAVALLESSITSGGESVTQAVAPALETLRDKMRELGY